MHAEQVIVDGATTADVAKKIGVRADVPPLRNQYGTKTRDVRRPTELEDESARLKIVANKR